MKISKIHGVVINYSYITYACIRAFNRVEVHFCDNSNPLEFTCKTYEEAIALLNKIEEEMANL